jgi:hypothetical protein
VVPLSATGSAGSKKEVIKTTNSRQIEALIGERRRAAKISPVTVENDIALGLLQAYLHTLFGQGYMIQAMRDEDDPRTVLFEIRKGLPNQPGAIACNARMLWAHLPMAITLKPIEQQIEDAIYDEFGPVPYMLSSAAINTCDHIHDRLMATLDQHAWTDGNRLD